MLGAGRRPQGVLIVTVRFNSDDHPSLDISFESYPDIWASKEIGPTLHTVEDACLELCQWLSNFIEAHDHRNGEVTH